MSLADRSSVTVVIPTRDRVVLLRETLRSVAEQVPAAAVIVVDDGSSDSTAEAVAGQPGVEVLRNEAGGWGAGRARNAGLDRVTTPLVAFLDSDDLLLPGALAALVAALHAEPTAPFAFGQALAAARADDGWEPDLLIAPLRAELADLRGATFARNVVPSSAAVVRTAAIRAIGGYDERLEFSEDHDLWLRLLASAPAAYVPRVVLIHRRHSGNRHAAASARRDDDTIRARALALPAFASYEPARLGTLLCEEGMEALRSRRPAELPAVLSRRLAGRRDRLRILHAAGRHCRSLFAARTAARALWDRDAALRAWLSTYT